MMSPTSAVCSDPSPSITSTPPLPGSDRTDFSRALSSKQRTVVIGPANIATGRRTGASCRSQLRTSGSISSTRSAVGRGSMVTGHVAIASHHDVVDELRQPRFDVVVVLGEPLVGQVHLAPGSGASRRRTRRSARSMRGAVCARSLGRPASPVRRRRAWPAASAASSASPSALTVDPVLLGQACASRCCDCFQASVSPQRLLGLDGVLVAERGRCRRSRPVPPPSAGFRLRCAFISSSTALIVSLQPVGPLEEQRVLAPQVGEHVDVGVVEQGADLVERQARPRGTPAPGAGARRRRRCSRGSRPPSGRWAPRDRCGRSGAACGPRHRSGRLPHRRSSRPCRHYRP